MNFIHPSCWNPRKIVIRKNKVSFHSSFWDLIKTDRRTNYVSFHHLYRVSRRTDVQTLLFIRHNRIKIRQTDRLRFISPLNLDPSKTDGQLFHPHMGIKPWQTSFHPSYWNPRTTDGQTTLHFIPHIAIHVWHTDKLRFISSLIHVWQTDGHFISPFILGSTSDRRTNYASFHPKLQTMFCFTRMLWFFRSETDRQTILFHQSQQGRQTH